MIPDGRVVGGQVKTGLVENFVGATRPGFFGLIRGRGQLRMKW